MYRGYFSLKITQLQPNKVFFNYSIGFIQNIRLNAKVTFKPCYTLIDVLHARKTFYF